MRWKSVALIIFILAGYASARILNVPSEYPTIQAGIDASVNGDTVLVAPGIYEANTIVIQDKNILLTSSEGPANTEIRACVWIRGTSVDTTCVLRGFRLNGQYVSGWPDYLVSIWDVSPLIWGNVIENNHNDNFGAGIMALESGAIIRGNMVRGNSSCGYGGGIYALNFDSTHSREVVIEGNVISGNRAGWCMNDEGDCGGIAMWAPGVVRYNLIASNAAYHPVYYASAGGLDVNAARTQVYNNTIVGNSAMGGTPSGHGRGGGLCVFSWSPEGDGFAKNNIVAFNPWGGGVDADVDDTTFRFIWDYNLVFGNDTIDYMDMEPGPHDIQSDPMFVNRFSGDYRLLSNSPCIDAGDPDMPLDPDSTRADIGAYYFDQSVAIEGDDASPSPFRFTLRQNYPNPFNGQTIISYHLNEEAVVSLFIFSITGHLVMPLVNTEPQEAGEHTYLWEGRDVRGLTVSTGVYFYELYVNGNRESRAMIMIK
ncbi:MAG: hypothetical protein A2W25_07045 [candidate division Zixibacteria bacterium RBG_16_53_22]|nr:MAG: hypothetical protein A2W25_07045 [candidate division Zixibacteria bacterium RBG_16_53_22]